MKLIRNLDGKSFFYFDQNQGSRCRGNDFTRANGLMEKISSSEKELFFATFEVSQIKLALFQQFLICNQFSFLSFLCGEKVAIVLSRLLWAISRLKLTIIQDEFGRLKTAEDD